MRQSCLKPVHLLFLRKAYELSEQNDANGVEPGSVQRALSLGDEEGDAVLESLAEEGLVIWPAKGQVLMTKAGTDMVLSLVREVAAASPPMPGHSARDVLVEKG